VPNVNDEAPTRAALLGEAIAAELRAEKGAKKLEYKELAALTEIPERSVYRYFNYERKIDAVQLILVADALGTTAEEIVARARKRSGI
jgi:transcriptional regulator with XRE-family HTH domain